MIKREGCNVEADLADGGKALIYNSDPVREIVGIFDIAGRPGNAQTLVYTSEVTGSTCKTKIHALRDNAEDIYHNLHAAGAHPPSVQVPLALQAQRFWAAHFH